MRNKVVAWVLIITMGLIPFTQGFATTVNSAVVQQAESVLSSIPNDRYQVEPETIFSEIRNKEKPFILDIRSSKEYKKGHLQGAYHVPWGNAIADKLSFFPKNKTIYVLSWDGQLAAQATTVLNMAGYKARYVSSGYLYVEDHKGYEQYTEVTSNVIKDLKTPVDEDVKSFVKTYFKSAITPKDSRFANHLVSDRNLKSMLKKDKSSVVIVDVRSRSDFDNGHFSSALSIPFDSGMQKELMSLPKNKKIVVVCYTAQDSGVVAAAMRGMGYDAVSMNGGVGVYAIGTLNW